MYHPDKDCEMGYVVYHLGAHNQRPTPDFSRPYNGDLLARKATSEHLEMVHNVIVAAARALPSALSASRVHQFEVSEHHDFGVSFLYHPGVSYLSHPSRNKDLGGQACYVGVFYLYPPGKDIELVVSFPFHPGEYIEMSGFFPFHPAEDQGIGVLFNKRSSKNLSSCDCSLTRFFSEPPCSA
jgi:hypothetical protein